MWPRVGLVHVLIVAACLVLTGCKKKAPPPAAPPEVLFVTVEPRDVPIYKEWIGSLEGFVNAQIRAQVTGYLLSQDYEEGSEVEKGDLLFQIDPRPFQATLDQAKAKLTQDQAQQGKTEQDVRRYKPLAAQNAISQQELDDAVQANQAALALVKADQAAVESAQLNLGFTRITSPIAGLAGIAAAQRGDLVGPTGQPLTTVSTIDPLKVYFNVSEQSYLAYRRQYATPAERTAHERDLEFQLILADGSTYSQPGKLYAVGREVNPTTGTLQIVGLFPNPDFTLRPGEFARVRARTEIKKGALTVPQRAVNELQGSYQVITLDAQNHAHVQPVKVGEQIEGGWIIEQGLKPGARVVVEGGQKAKEGMLVSPQPFVSAGQP